MEDYCSFRKALENLNNCGYCSAPMLPRLTLPHDDFQVSASIPEEAFGSRLHCIQAAEHRLHEYYVEAERQFALYSDPLSAEGILMQFGQHFSSRLKELRAQLEACRTPENTAGLDAVLCCLVPEEVFQAAEALCKALEQRYVLPTENAYRKRIAYEKYDPSVAENNPAAKLVAKLFTRYGFDLLCAIQQLESDGTRLLQQYKAAFDAQMALEIERLVIRPALRALETVICENA